MIGGEFSRGRVTTGAAVSLGKTDIDGVNGADGDGKFIGLGLYSGYRYKDWLFMGDMQYAWNKTDVNAYISGLPVAAEGIDSTVFSLGMRAERTVMTRGAMTISPFAGLRYSHYSRDGYEFTSPNIAQSVSVLDSSMDQWTMPLGVKLAWNCGGKVHGMTLKPSLELAYVRAFGDTDIDSAMHFNGTGKSLGTTAGVDPVSDKDTFRATLHIEGKRENLTLGIDLNGQFSDNRDDWGVRGQIKWDL